MLAVALLVLGKAGWMDAKALVAQQLLRQAWQQTGSDQGSDKDTHKPWPWFDSRPVAELTWPDGRRQILLQGMTGQAMAFAPGLELMDGQARTLDIAHWQLADTLIAGAHNDTHFAGLEDLSIGAELSLQFPDGTRQSYRVASKQVRDSRAHDLLPASHSGGMHGQLLLVTCYPFHALTPGGPLRYVVTANPV